MSSHLSYWFKQALEMESPLDTQTLATDISADVAIVGGGYTGLWTAIMLKQQQPHLDIVVIDKGLCGSGASGANGGCMLTWSTKYPTLKRLFGEEQAKWLVEESEQAVYDIEQFCFEHNIDAQLYRSGTFYTATNSAQQGQMQPIVEQLEQLACNSWTSCSKPELTASTGSNQHIEGHYSPAAGSVQPALLVRGLRRVAIQLGIKVYENTAMERLEFGSPAVVNTPHGSIYAGKVVLGLNAWMIEHFKPFKRSIVVVSSDMVITDPIKKQLEQSGLKQGASVVDSRIFVHYYRDTKDGRLMLGKGGNQFSFANRVDPMFNKQSQYADLISRSFSHLFPELGQSEFAYSWTGGSDRSVTGLPFFGHLDGQENIVYGFGYSGNGVTQTRIGAKILTSLVLERQDAWSQCGLAKGPLGYFPPEPIRWLGAMMVRNAVRRKEDAEDREETPRPWDKWLAKFAGAAGKADKVE
ncbi:FAD dependent oxidoreductase [Vibrio sinaloensis DSM 21326]|uniref:FAD dependent oxidoreductase n=1 Tax=Vibrio sinaloensis DSM 21326 TaxID=945550 RepID=E8M9A5_PHOS4|nr:FAD-dependent oxidoreductase [Vibrio sinaloensis]EGA69461.1 FAD dependent oxidoreductase [Vibrio sinaloensis DSM 21326]